MTNKERVKDLERKLNIHKKAVLTRDEMIKSLKEQLAGYMELELVYKAYISILLELAGGEVLIEKTKLQDFISQKNGPVQILITDDAEKGTYALKQVNLEADPEP